MKRYNTAPSERLHFLLKELQEICNAPPHIDIKVAQAVAELLKIKAHRRPRTLAEIRSLTQRMMRSVEGLAERPLASLQQGDCEYIIEKTFSTPRQRAKGRVILHSLFEQGCRRHWCWHNPIAVIEKPQVIEHEIEPLHWEEIQRLLATARQPAHHPCMPALGLMLWAGLRPAEVERLGWEHLDWDERVIIVSAQHAKTGGCRHVTLQAALATWLREAGVQQEGSICPKNWSRRWKRLRREAQLEPWRQDVLRHTFASYHAKHWHDFSRLQMEMGHRSAQLLRTRYLSMRRVSAKAAALFWKGDISLPYSPVSSA